MMAGPSNRDIMNEVIRLSELIEGDPNNRDDDGYAGDVKKNTVFRRNVEKMYWRFVTALIVGNTPIIWLGSQWLANKIRGV